MNLTELETKKLSEGFITLETARLLKEAGFSEGINGYYVDYLTDQESDNPSFNMVKGEVGFETMYMRNNNIGDLSNRNYICYACPSQSQAAKWLREKHNKQVYSYSSTTAYRNSLQKFYKDYVVYVNGASLNDARDEEYPTYEAAMEYGLQWVLKEILR